MPKRGHRGGKQYAHDPVGREFTQTHRAARLIHCRDRNAYSTAGRNPMPTDKLDLAALKDTVLAFCHFPLQAQVVTLNRNGRPIGRTLGADLNPDFTVDLLTSPFIGRVKQVRRSPEMLFSWVEGKRPGCTWPRVVFARGSGAILQGDPVVAAYEARVARYGKLPHLVRIDMTFEEPRRLDLDEIRARMCVIHFVADEIRAEGFSAADEPMHEHELLQAVTW
jgi:hypothetical protein